MATQHLVTAAVPHALLNQAIRARVALQQLRIPALKVGVVSIHQHYECNSAKHIVCIAQILFVETANVPVQRGVMMAIRRPEMVVVPHALLNQDTRALVDPPRLRIPALKV